MYQPGSIYTRSPEEKRDMFLAWDRTDKAFFASGACHILAHQFTWMHQHEGFELIHINPKNKNHGGHHMFASDGKWAFDFNGWTLEEELLREYKEAYKEKFTEWEYDRVVVPLDWRQFGEYLLAHHHRPPEYLKQFPSESPKGQ